MPLFGVMVWWEETKRICLVLFFYRSTCKFPTWKLACVIWEGGPVCYNASLSISILIFKNTMQREVTFKASPSLLCYPVSFKNSIKKEVIYLAHSICWVIICFSILNLQFFFFFPNLVNLIYTLTSGLTALTGAS